MRFRLALAALLFASPALAEPRAGSGPISPERLSAYVKEMASDRFQGRAPGTPGEAVTVNWLAGEWRRLGLEPAGENGGYFQSVPLVRTQVTAADVTVTAGGAARKWTQGEDVYVSTVRPMDRIAADAPLVFVGYGVKAAERGWDDFKGADLKGKILVFLVNDPDFEAQPGDASVGKFGGRAMTYYGRWTYKYEEAARQGAAGALIVHETAGAGYGWQTVRAPGGENYDIVRGAGDVRVPFQGWIARERAAELFAASGQDLEALKRAARRADFRPVTLKATLKADLAVRHEQVTSRNVLAKITGSKHPRETVMVSGHWDAYGVGAPSKDGQTIRRGAADDAVGVAGMLEIARALKAGPRPERTVVFAAWTGEERGLLGSETYGVRPLFPHALMAANLTMDVLQLAGPARDMVLVGKGQSSLDDHLAQAAARQGRTLTADAAPERGLFYRADHFSLAKRGVPVLLLMGMGGGHDLVAGGRAAGDKWVSDYTANCYHQTCDSWTPALDFRGAAQDVEALYDITRRLASSREWPAWTAGSEFKAERDRTAAERR